MNWVHFDQHRSEHPHESITGGITMCMCSVEGCRGLHSWDGAKTLHNFSPRHSCSLSMVLSTPRATTPIFSVKLLRMSQTQLLSITSNTDYADILIWISRVCTFLCIYIHTHMHTSGHNGNKILIIKYHYM